MAHGTGTATSSGNCLCYRLRKPCPFLPCFSEVHRHVSGPNIGSTERLPLTSRYAPCYFFRTFHAGTRRVSWGGLFDDKKPRPRGARYRRSLIRLAPADAELGAQPNPQPIAEPDCRDCRATRCTSCSRRGVGPGCRSQRAAACIRGGVRHCVPLASHEPDAKRTPIFAFAPPT